MRSVRLFAAVAIAASTIPAYAQPAQTPAAPAAPGQTPPPTTTSPAPQPPGAPATTAPATQPGTTVPPLTTRTFTAPVGMWFVTVRPDRIGDFEQAVAHLQAALAKATDARTREQAKGWRMLKASEPGPNATVLYVFLIDPPVPGADYGLGSILAGAYPDTTELAEIWRMYTGAITGGGSLLNLTPIAPKIVPFGEKGTPVRVTPSATPATTSPPPATPQPAVPPTTVPQQ